MKRWIVGLVAGVATSLTGCADAPSRVGDRSYASSSTEGVAVIAVGSPRAGSLGGRFGTPTHLGVVNSASGEWLDVPLALHAAGGLYLMDDNRRAWLMVLKLPAGKYTIQRWRIADTPSSGTYVAGAGPVLMSGQKGVEGELAIPFEVKAGRIRYLGEVLVAAVEGAYTTSIYDCRERDIPLALRKNENLDQALVDIAPLGDGACPKYDIGEYLD